MFPFKGVSGLSFKLIGTNVKNIFWSQKLALPLKRKEVQLTLEQEGDGVGVGGADPPAVDNLSIT